MFGYPKKEAATAAIEAVRDYIDETKSEIKVVFNVFTDEDYDIYQELYIRSALKWQFEVFRTR